MILTKLQARRFFKMFDALTLYANARLDVVEPSELVVDTPRGIDDQAQGEVAFELWQNLGVIDDFVRENPAGLSAGELDVVAQWRAGLTDHFMICEFPDGIVRFLGRGFAFEVCGISQEIVDMVGDLPVFAQTTLLPFDGLIVFSEYLSLMPVQYSRSILDMVERDVRDVYEKGRIVDMAKELLIIADEQRASQLDSDIESMLAELDELERASGSQGRNASGSASSNAKSAPIVKPDFRSKDKQLKGKPLAGEAPSADIISFPMAARQPNSEIDLDDQDDEAPFADEYATHRGVLAGLEFEERERVANEHFDTERGLRLRIADRLKEACEKGGPKNRLADCLALDTKQKLLEAAKLFDVRNASKLRKAELAERLAEAIATPQRIEYMATIVSLGANSLKALKRLVDARGLLRVLEDDVKSLADLPRPMTGLCYVYYENGLFSFVMPDETLEAAREVDWDGLIAKAERYGNLALVAETLLELRGIVPIDDVASEFRHLYPGAYEKMVDLVDDLLDSVATGYASFTVVDDGDEVYLLHYLLAWERDYDLGRPRHSSSDPDAPIIDNGPIGATAAGLLRQQEGKEPRPIEPAMLEKGSLFDWKMRQPCARALIAFLDANVPDVRDDYYFAEKVFEDLEEEFQWGALQGAVERYFAILEDNDFIPKESQMQEVLNLLMACANGLPVWPNNGWAPNELLERETGRRLFLDEKGMPRKIGRNDPCPCGSGKKYKKCCGR